MNLQLRPDPMVEGDVFYQTEVVNQWVLTEPDEFIFYGVLSIAHRIQECTAKGPNWWTTRYMLKSEVTRELKTLLSLDETTL